MLCTAASSTKELKVAVQEVLGILAEDQMLSSPSAALSMALLCDDSTFTSPDGEIAHIQVRVRCLGGKGGFGAMLRGQQSRPGMKQVDVNTGAMRDLSGRRLRHVEQEQKLAEWAADADKRKAEKELEKKEKRQKIWDETHKMAEEYVAEASIDVESVQEAVLKGLEEDKKKKEKVMAEQAAKRLAEKEAAKKLDKLWGNNDDDSGSSSSDDSQAPAAKDGKHTSAKDQGGDSEKRSNKAIPDKQGKHDSGADGHKAKQNGAGHEETAAAGHKKASDAHGNDGSAGQQAHAQSKDHQKETVIDL